MEKKETLKDGTELTIRNITIDDLEQLINFFSELPVEDRRYLRIDVTDRKLVEERLRTAKSRGVTWIAAFLQNKMIAEGRLQLSLEDWRGNQGEIRLIVAKEFQKKGIGSLMMRELYWLAVEAKVELAIVKFMRPQIGARKVSKKFGFSEQTLIPDYVRDQEHKSQDLIIMTCNMNDFWKELEHFYGRTDWQRCR